MKPDLSNPEVKERLKTAYAIVARARARRLQREAEQEEQTEKKSA